MIRILIADNQMLTREGIIAIIAATPDMEIIGEAKNNDELEYIGHSGMLDHAVPCAFDQ